jgi:hypothetical protein
MGLLHGTTEPPGRTGRLRNMKPAFQLGRRLRPPVAAAIACGAVVAVSVGAAACGQLQSPLTARIGADRGVAPGQLSVISGTGIAMGAHIDAASRRRAVGLAERLLADVRVPSGSRLVESLPGRRLTGPAFVPLCDPVEDDAVHWLVPLSAGALTTFLTGHVPAAMSSEGSGTETSDGRVTTFFVTDDPRAHSESGDELVFTLTPIGTSTELGADALTVPAGADCVDPGGPEVRAKGVRARVNPGGLPTFVKGGSHHR